MENITSKHLKSALLSYFRFERRMVVVTEVPANWGYADVLACSYDLSTSIEVEVKISISDLKQDFKKKPEKHWSLSESKFAAKENTNYFYFCIPEDLYDEACPIIQDNNKKYGIITFNASADIKKYLLERKMNDLSYFLTFKNNAQKLNDTNNAELLRKIVMRNNTEICVFYKKEIMQEINKHE